MNTTTLQELFELARDNAAKLFQEDGEVTPIWHAVTNDDVHAIISTPWFSRREKEEDIAALRELFKLKHVERYAFICEAWSMEVRSLRDAFNVAPSEHPDRREVVRVTATDRQGTTLSGQYYILRPEHGPPKLSPFRQDDKSIEVGGLMMSLFETAKH